MKRACGVLVVLGVLAASLVATSGAASAGTRYRVTVAAPTSVTVGRTVTLTGKVSPNSARKGVSLQRYSNGGWHKVAKTKLGARSRYSFTRTFKAAGTYKYRVVKAGSSSRARGVSRSVRITAVAAPRGYYSVSIGFAHSCALKHDQSLWCWGRNNDGELGLADTTYRPQPVRIGTATWRSVSAGSAGTCGVKMDQTLWCWGQFEQGPPVAGVQANRFLPTRVGTQNTWKAVSTGGGGVCAVRTNFTAACWTKYDVYDQDAGIRTIPVNVPYDDWLSLPVAPRGAPGCGLRLSGHLWCLPAPTESFPSEFDGSKWRMFSPGNGHTCGVKADSSAWCWGNNTGGAIGPYPTTGVPQKFDNAAWRTVSAGDELTCGIKTTGTLWCWGNNTNGRLGAGPAAPSSSTVALQVGAANTWTSVTAGNGYSCATRTDGSLWCWGNVLAPGEVDPGGGPVVHSTPVRLG